MHAAEQQQQLELRVITQQFAKPTQDAPILPAGAENGEATCQGRFLSNPVAQFPMAIHLLPLMR
jgi:hypothetical protein